VKDVGLIRKRMRQSADPERTGLLQKFFKTGPGEYGEGDLFLGLRVPQVRSLAKDHHSLDLRSVVTLLHSRVHEERLFALLVMVARYRREEHLRDKVYRLYLENTRWINNWDLVDSTAGHIVGAHLRDRDRSILRKLCRSESLWERRIAVISTSYFIRRGDFGDTLTLAGLLLDDGEDLIHKAVGWMLREVGKRDRRVLEGWLRERYGTMPRTMLRYAIERFPEPLRRRYLKGKI
jgi:3-methyladenine DNA glycosylase AlkD